MQVKSKKYDWRKPFGVLFNSLFSSLNFGLVILLLASSFSDLVSPMKNIIFAYLGLAFPLLVIANVCFFVYWIFAHKWWWVFLLTLVFVACWKPFFRYCPFYPATVVATDDETVIKLMSYNVMSFAYKDHSRQSPNKIIEYIAASGADVVCLQEYMVSTRPNLMDSKDVEAALPMYPYIEEIIFSSHNKGGYKYGLAVLSKFPITRSQRITFPSVYNGSALHDINIRGRKLTIVNNHLESFKLTSEDISQYSEIITRANFEHFESFSGSIQQKLGQAFRIRANQTETVVAAIRKANSYYTVSCGDLNDTPISYSHKVFNDHLLDAYAETGFGPGISYNRNFFPFRIDHIFHSASIEASNCRVDRSIRLSDHYPIYCYIKLK
ncbi:MAG: endonuclease/exonuclease/phosphatase family protein [Tannerella sp.]|jgi:endonuclease/exonuclease/phosphatase family metal-dependent hydrolase|nr:endonuclease/exonuclease/phosphatase family protein [Tannerella sp.]